MSEKVEFIESYIKAQGGDYRWNDNHGELIRCKDCKYSEQMCKPWKDLFCIQNRATHIPDWFCADGERREENENSV